MLIAQHKILVHALWTLHAPLNLHTHKNTGNALRELARADCVWNECSLMSWQGVTAIYACTCTFMKNLAILSKVVSVQRWKAGNGPGDEAMLSDKLICSCQQDMNVWCSLQAELQTRRHVYHIPHSWLRVAWENQKSPFRCLNEAHY